MDSDKYKVIYCPEDDKLCIERYYKNHFYKKISSNSI